MRFSRVLLLAASLGLATAHPAKRQQPNTPNTGPLDLEPLTWGDINFVHSTDIHGWLEGHLLQPSYNGDMGDFYSFAVRMKQKARQLRKDLLVVDTGDTHDGNGLSDTTKPPGKITQPILKNIPYDILCIGNHELYGKQLWRKVNEVTADVVTNFVPHWKGRYLAANVYFKDLHNNKTVPVGNKYTYFEAEFGTRVLALGFLFDFDHNGNQSVIHKVADEIKEPWFNEALDHKPDVIVLIGHIGLDFAEFKTVISAIRQRYPYLPIAVLGGHTHIRDFKIYDAWAAGIESGRYMETIGFFSVDGIAATKKFIQEHGYNSSDVPANLTFHRRYLDQNRETYIFHSSNDSKTFDTKIGQEITRNITYWRDELDVMKPYGCAPQNYYISAAPIDSNQSIYNLLTTEILPKVVADPTRPYQPYFIMNSGSQRFDIYKGNFTLDTMYQVSPFVDRFIYIAGVPYNVVSKILGILNNQGEQNKKRSLIWPQAPHTHFEAEQRYLAMQHELSRRAELTPGYTTTDDLGSNGDDTKHSPIPYYKTPWFFASSLPTNATDDTLLDLVFLEFSHNQMVSIMHDLTGKNWTVEAQYGNPEVTTSSMYEIYAKKYWAGNCAN
ncbi:hypothetical protein EC973_003406 [Apophysomyces ossiformis]|uniref:Calcineurin-like phosphoesterase domain-containing protein n=1 Tax=Apophysomyces ossiformis TaxID=679940 RepID=A0A8H7ESW7_9FUNG|nr:hypothetical protein EC973_003406 [Apophysomyces ossiformis]